MCIIYVLIAKRKDFDADIKHDLCDNVIKSADNHRGNYLQEGGITSSEPSDHISASSQLTYRGIGTTPWLSHSTISDPKQRNRQEQDGTGRGRLSYICNAQMCFEPKYSYPYSPSSSQQILNATSNDRETKDSHTFYERSNANLFDNKSNSNNNNSTEVLRFCSPEVSDDDALVLFPWEDEEGEAHGFTCDSSEAGGTLLDARYNGSGYALENLEVSLSLPYTLLWALKA